MKKLFAISALLILALASMSAQTTIKFKRGAASARDSLRLAEPGLDTNSAAINLWIGGPNDRTGGLKENFLLAGDSITYGSQTVGTDTGSTDAYAITLAPNVPKQYFDGMLIKFRANTANTGAATLNVNSLGAKTIYRADGTALSNSDIAEDQVTIVVYLDSAFYLQSSLPVTSVIVGDSLSASLAALGYDIIPDVTNTQDIGSATKQLDTVYTRAIKVDGNVADNAYTAQTAKFLSFDSQGMNIEANGQAWANEKDIYFLPISVPYAMSPDSMYLYANGAGGGDDSIEVGFYSYDGATRYLVSGLKRYAPTTTPSVVAIGFDTQTVLQPGLYLFASTIVSNSGAPVNTLLYGLALNNNPGYFFQLIHDGNGARHIGKLVNVTSTGRLPATLNLGAAVDLGANDYAPLIYILDFGN